MGTWFVSDIKEFYYTTSDIKLRGQKKNRSDVEDEWEK
jgi:hypothetical protein